ncbi:MAG TPA: hypothetical protein VMT52_03385, partial [Planctomycetota bacterium]|nr:hypothetical protein [Planctomycetota bacterium]
PATVTVEAFVESAPGKPYEEPLVDAVITRKLDGKTARLRLEPVPRSGGRHRGAISLEKAGLLEALDPRAGAQELSVELDVPGIPDYSSDPRRAKAAFVVEPPPDPESRDLACDTRLLEEMAAASGGRFLPFSRFREAGDVLPAKSRIETRTEESSPWDHPAALAPIVLGLLALEYVLRKRRDLV